MLKYDIKGKFIVGLHLDLFYTKNIPLMQYFLFSVLITKLYQVTDNIIYIPKNITIYVEVPNGPQSFIDDFPILKLFQTTCIKIKEQTPLRIDDNNIIKRLSFSDNIINNDEIENMIGLNKNKESPMIYIEKQIYMNIISSLCPDNKLNKNNKIYNKVLLTANYFTKSIYSQKIRKKPEEIKNIFEFLEFNEE